MEMVGEVMNWRMSIKTFTSVPSHGSGVMKGAVSSYSYRLLVCVQIEGMRTALSVGVGVWENEQRRRGKAERSQRSLVDTKEDQDSWHCAPSPIPHTCCGEFCDENLL